MTENEGRKIQLPTLEQIETERNKLKYRREYRKIFLSTIGALLVVAAIAVLIATMFLPVLQVSGTSMEPTLEDGEIIVLRKTDKFKTGELVGFYYQSKILLKRVIGKAGDYIDMDEEGNVFVNGELIDEPYVLEKSVGECDIEFPYQVPENKVFVMGDHRSTSIDSRNSTIGCVDVEQVVGKVMFRVWPFGRLGFLK
ncbi:signal peptidase I [Roseburia hominis]